MPQNTCKIGFPYAPYKHWTPRVYFKAGPRPGVTRARSHGRPVRSYVVGIPSQQVRTPRFSAPPHHRTGSTFHISVDTLRPGQNAATAGPSATHRAPGAFSSEGSFSIIVGPSRHFTSWVGSRTGREDNHTTSPGQAQRNRPGRSLSFPLRERTWKIAAGHPSKHHVSVTDVGFHRTRSPTHTGGVLSQ